MRILVLIVLMVTGRAVTEAPQDEKGIPAARAAFCTNQIIRREDIYKTAFSVERGGCSRLEVTALTDENGRFTQYVHVYAVKVYKGRR